MSEMGVELMSVFVVLFIIKANLIFSSVGKISSRILKILKKFSSFSSLLSDLRL
jgi:hypothetical protein